MILRDATIDDLALLRQWDKQAHVIAADPHYDWHWEIELHRNSDWRKQLIAEIEGIPIGFVQIIDPAKEESHYWADIGSNLNAIDIWIGDIKNTGKGYGSTIMTMIIARCFSNRDIEAIFVDPLSSNLRAHKFYERLRFKYIEQRIFDSELCHVYRLDRI